MEEWNGKRTIHDPTVDNVISYNLLYERKLEQARSSSLVLMGIIYSTGHGDGRQIMQRIIDNLMEQDEVEVDDAMVERGSRE